MPSADSTYRMAVWHMQIPGRKQFFQRNPQTWRARKGQIRAGIWQAGPVLVPGSGRFIHAGIPQNSTCPSPRTEAVTGEVNIQNPQTR